MSARILIVDDEEIVIRSCKRILDGDEFQVESVQDGREALRKVEENSYDVMILDIMMPNIDGLEVLRRVKETHPERRCHHDHRPVADRHRRAGDEARRFRLHFQAVRAGRTEARRAARAGAPPPAAGKPQPQKRGVVEIPLREHHRPEPADAGRLPADRAVRADQLDRADHRRKRHRQGTDRARDPLQQPAQGQALRRGRLQRAEREPAGKRVVRPRQRRLHRRGRQQEGHVRGGRRRHAVPRRDRQHLDVDPGQAVARAAGARIPRGRRYPRADRQCPAGHRHQQGPQGDGRGRHLPRRPLLPDQHLPDPRPGAARARERHPGARFSFPQSVQRRVGKECHRHFRRRADRRSPITTGRATCANSKTSCTARRS